MTRINIEEVVDHLDIQMRKAMEDAVYSTVPDAAFDGHSLFREFKRAVGSECGTWVEIPDTLIEN
ncbi:MAG: hypothetical protein WA610_03450 [Thermodesulfovibrionales bacterium]